MLHNSKFVLAISSNVIFAIGTSQKTSTVIETPIATLETMPPEVRNELRILYVDKNTCEAMNALAREVWTVSYEQVTEEKMETPQ